MATHRSIPKAVWKVLLAGVDKSVWPKIPAKLIARLAALPKVRLSTLHTLPDGEFTKSLPRSIKLVVSDVGG